ncbi:hypothetical protein M427DRAFT_328676 [Gonapodya prolifera JEL478]|uniref:Uncharacterized protein n=1 Tax=Gonapodya prolifera (strain JEL478) TaxID=1344416 RepID=A0A139AEH3_GONPJ|nr:hypothetical protein M427DRAFT_328676 [Gonapodya prolifera JEL478]|eukprot:KXS15079.1 hypothetical protein M427DRAFT_328676 [Gonapodya prolifera JEL478]
MSDLAKSVQNSAPVHEITSYIEPLVKWTVQNHWLALAPLSVAQFVTSSISNGVLAPSVPGLSLLGVEVSSKKTLTAEQKKVAEARARITAEASYRGFVRLSSYLVPVLVLGKLFVFGRPVDRTDVDASWSLVKFATRYHFAVVGPLILLQNMIARESEATKGIEPFRWLIDTAVLVGAIVQTYSKYYLTHRAN